MSAPVFYKTRTKTHLFKECYNIFMKKFFTVFFVVLGVIFFILILAVTYSYLTDDHMSELTKHTNETSTSTSTEKTATNTNATEISSTTKDKNPVLSPTQEKALEVIGVDPTEVPSSFTPEQITCFENILGKVRVTEIKNGDTPSATEFYKAKECL